MHHPALGMRSAASHYRVERELGDVFHAASKRITNRRETGPAVVYFSGKVEVLRPDGPSCCFVSFVVKNKDKGIHQGHKGSERIPNQGRMPGAATASGAALPETSSTKRPPWR